MSVPVLLEIEFRCVIDMLESLLMVIQCFKLCTWFA